MAALASSAPRIGVMGGTFDPIHHAHLVAAAETAFALDLDQVIFVPAGDPWQKADEHVTPAKHRVELVRRAIGDEPRFKVSLVDVERQGPSYTTDTLQDLSKQFPDAEFFFITGTDALNGVFSWHRPELLFELAHLVSCTRAGSKLDYEVVEKIPQDRLTLLEIPLLEISSTDLRRRIAHREPVRYLLPDSVVDYIEEFALYEGTP
jgi:nicotinate-nucleotide adenylyltransferase